MTVICKHRGILIRQSEVPGAPFDWLHEEADAHGTAATLNDAIRQIDLHLGSAETDCGALCETGHADAAPQKSEVA